MAKWHYTGDMNLEHGGVYFRVQPGDDFAEAVEVTPCSAMGGPDNMFEIVSGSIPMPVKQRTAALATCGYWQEVEGDGPAYICDCAGGRFPEDSPEAEILLVDAFRAYHGVEPTEWQETVRIGPPDPLSGSASYDRQPDRILRGNAKLANYVRRAYL